MDGKIIFKNEQGENEEFTVLLETKVNNIKYILVEKEDEEIAYIFKDTSDDSSEEAVYEVVLDEDEVGYIGKIFSELLEDVDWKVENNSIRRFRADWNEYDSF